MQIKIYAGEKAIFLSDKINEELKKLSGQRDVVLYKDVIDENGINAITLIEELNAKNKSAAIIIGKDFNDIKKDFFTQFNVIEAAGGIVQNEKKELLFIYRKNKWDLPKGKLDPGETAETCAEREIEEETGVSGLLLKRKVGETYHIYRENEKDILKISRWFYFTCPSGQNLRPQPEEDITEVKWVPTRLIKEPMANTYKTIRDIMTAFFDTP